MFNHRTYWFALFVAASIFAVAAPAWCQPARPESELLAVLKSDTATREAKEAACIELGRVGDAQAIPVLVALLGDEQNAHMARYALEQMPGHAPVDALRAALPTLHGLPQVGVLQSLGVRRDVKAVDAIAGLLKDKDPQVASAAAYALGHIGDVAAAKAIAQELNAAPATLLPAVRDAALTCADLLSREGHGVEAVALFDQVRRSDAPVYVRAAAAHGAVLAHGGDGGELLAALLEDPERQMFDAALRVAIELPGEPATGALTAQLVKLPPARAALLLRALAERGDRAALPAVRAALTNSDPAIRVAALAAVAKFGDVESLPAVLQTATDTNPDIAAAAATAIVRLPGQSVDSALMEWATGSDAARSVIAMECLSRRQTTAAAGALLKIVETANDPRIRMAALQAVGHVGGAGEAAALGVFLSRAKSTDEQAAAEQSLGSICAIVPDREALADKLTASLGDATPEGKRALLRVLMVVGGNKALAAECAAIKETNADVQDTAIHALCDWPSVEAAPNLLELAKNAPQENYRTLAVCGYLRLAGDAGIPAARQLEMCNTAQSMVTRLDEKRLLLSTLGRVSAVDALALILPYLEDGAVREEACVAAIAVARKSVQGGADPGAAAPMIRDAMEKVVKATRNDRTRASARDLLKQFAQGSK